MSSRKTESGKVATIARADAISYSDVQQRIICIRDKSVIIDVDVAALYGVETKHVNQAVRNNWDKFQADYVFELTSGEVEDLRSKILTTKLSSKSRVAPKAFTEKGLYMLATILKSKRATLSRLSPARSARLLTASARAASASQARSRIQLGAPQPPELQIVTSGGR